jgi:hypothetical protein
MRDNYLNLKKLFIPKKYKFIQPRFESAYEKSKGYDVFSNISKNKFLERCKLGKKSSIKKIGLKNIKNVYTSVNHCVPWKLVKFKEELKFTKTLKKIEMPILLKIDEKEYYVIDGNNLIGLFTHYKKDVNVWLIDESLNTQDFKNRIKKSAEEFYPVYDYGNITKDDKALVKEIIKILEKENQYGLSEQLKLTFGLNNIAKYNIEESVFYNLCKENNITVSKQGDIKVSENGNHIEYPIVSICEDIRKVDKFIENIFKKYGVTTK